uniref:Uncharacterized protein n=1 Tax=Glossina austeni TaxID=7395 RepID=A0A1A9ULT4_GLOAU
MNDMSEVDIYCLMLNERKLTPKMNAKGITQYTYFPNYIAVKKQSKQPSILFGRDCISLYETATEELKSILRIAIRTPDEHSKKHKLEQSGLKVGNIVVSYMLYVGSVAHGKNLP